MNYYSGKGGKYIRNHFPHHILDDYLRIENKYIKNISDRMFWEGLPDELQKHYLEKAERYLDYDWKSIPAYDTYMVFHIEGIRNDELALEKRNALGFLVTAECIENSGRFLPQIVNGIFSIAEHTTWAGSSSLANCGAAKECLPEYDDVVLDLRVVETGALFAYVYGSLKEKLEKISPVICRRIKHEVSRRILKPYLESNDYWWMCQKLDLSYWNINNWNTHMNLHIIYAALVLCDSKKECYQVINKAIDCLDVFVDSYPDDGSCNEGPSYWYMAGGDLSYALDLLNYAMWGKSNIFTNEKICNIMNYILNMRIAGNYFASVADAHGKEKGNPYTLYNIGTIFGNEAFINEAGVMFHFMEHHFPKDFFPIKDFVCMKYYRALTELGEVIDVGKKSVWLDGVQLLMSRESELRDKGFYMCVKGGHNGESHNHNDIGNVIVYKDGKPVMIDVGIGTYTKDTFGENRYTKVWSTNGYHHNIPIIDGNPQKEGPMFASTNVECVMTDNVDMISMQLKGAYTNQDKIQNLTRKVALDRTGGEIELTDIFVFKDAMNFESILMLQDKPAIRGQEIVLPTCKIKVEATLPVSLECTQIPLEDMALSVVWGPQIYRLVVKTEEAKSGRLKYVIS